MPLPKTRVHSPQSTTAAGTGVRTGRLVRGWDPNVFLGVTGRGEGGTGEIRSWLYRKQQSRAAHARSAAETVWSHLHPPSKKRPADWRRSQEVWEALVC